MSTLWNPVHLPAMVLLPSQHKWAQTKLQVMKYSLWLASSIGILRGMSCSLQNWQTNFKVSSLKLPSMQTRGEFLRWSVNCRICFCQVSEWVRHLQCSHTLWGSIFPITSMSLMAQCISPRWSSTTQYIAVGKSVISSNPSVVWQSAQSNTL